MTRFARIFFALALIFWPAASPAQLLTTNIGVGGFGGAAAGSTWDPATTAATVDVTLSGGNLIATRGASADGDETFWGNKAIAADAYFEVRCSPCNDDSGFGLVLERWGAANINQVASQALATGSNGAAIRGDGNTYPGADLNAGFGFHGVKTISIAYKLSNRHMWFSNDCGATWYGAVGSAAGQTPVTNTGGMDLNTIGGGGTPIAGPIYVGATLYHAGNAATLRTTSGSFSCTPPSGFPALN